LGHGLGLVDAAVLPYEDEECPALTLEVVWSAADPPSSGLETQVSLRREDGTKQAERYQVSPEWPTELWTADALVRSRYHLEIGPDLPDGLYEVALSLGEADRGESVGERPSIGQVVVGQSMGGRAVHSVDQALRARFGEGLRLLGYSRTTEEDRLSVRLHWLADERLEEDYKFFVHLVPAHQKKPLAQADVMPHEWTYPTTDWQRGQVVSDEIVLSTTGVPPGDYEVLVGVYDPRTGERLSIGDLAPGLNVREQRLVLPASITR
jgi:hypothetical protein